MTINLSGSSYLRSFNEFNATKRRQMEMTRLDSSPMNRWSQRMLGSKNLEARWATGLNSRYRERKHRLSSCLSFRLLLSSCFSLPLFPFSLSRMYKFFFLPFTTRYASRRDNRARVPCYWSYVVTIVTFINDVFVRACLKNYSQ